MLYPGLDIRAGIGKPQLKQLLKAGVDFKTAFEADVYKRQVIEVVNVLRENGAEVLGIASIFTYGMQKGLDRMAEAKVKNVSLSNYNALVEVAHETG